MKWNLKEFYYYITDRDKMLFNCIGPITNDAELNSKVVEAQKSGRNVRANSSFDLDEKDSHLDFYRNQGYTLIETLLVDEPKDTSSEYKGSLPDYAKKADRNRIVKVLCHTCNKTTFAEMTSDYPGEDNLSNSDLLKYEARCLKCGTMANDPYNWYR